MFVISYYGSHGSGMISVDNEPTDNLDSAMQFDSKEEAETKKEELQPEWDSRLVVESVTLA